MHFYDNSNGLEIIQYQVLLFGHIELKIKTMQRMKRKIVFMIKLLH